MVDRLELAGEGALLALLERRRKALTAEGLFAAERKRPLPFLPRVIGVVTSPTGAVIRDILHRLAERCPARVILWPVPVQGEGAAQKIAAAIRAFPSTEPRPDLLIVARGGGSIEDLWAFNEEEVVRAAAESPIPLISAVGHETDTTLIDFAVRPEGADPDRRGRDRGAGAQRASRPARRARASRPALPGAPGGAQPRTIRSHRLPLAASRRRSSRRWRRGSTSSASACRDRLRRAPAALAATSTSSPAGCAATFSTSASSGSAEQLGSLWRMAELAHPERPLSKGYVRVTARDGRTLTHAAEARAERLLTLRFADGSVDAAVDGGGRRPVERRPARSYMKGQPGLFDPAEE